MSTDESTFEVGATCERIGCWATFVTTAGRGRPRRYCSDECRRQADVDRTRCVARIDRLEELLRRERHLFAAMGGPDPTSSDAQSDASAAVD